MKNNYNMNHQSGKMNNSEGKFANYLKSQGKSWIFEPREFDLGYPCKKINKNVVYIPDFYCPAEDTWYEVSASKQAYSHSLKKIRRLRKIYPDLILKIVNPDGSEYLSELKKRKKICRNFRNLNIEIRKINKYRGLKGLTSRQITIFAREELGVDINMKNISRAMGNYKIGAFRRSALRSKIESNYYSKHRTATKKDVINWLNTRTTLNIGEDNMPFNRIAVRTKLFRKEIKQVDFANKVDIQEVRMSRILTGRIIPTRAEKQRIKEALNKL